MTTYETPLGQLTHTPAASSSTPISSLEQQLYSAITTGNVKRTHQIISEVASPEINQLKLGPDGLSPLHVACEHGQEEIVQLLLAECKCSIESCNSTGQSALHVAAQNGHVEIVKVLHQNWEQLSKREQLGSNDTGSGHELDQKSETISEGVSSEDLPRVLNGIDPSDTATQETLSEPSGLVASFSFPHPSAQGLSISFQFSCDISGNTALHLAAAGGQVPVVQYLLREADCSPTLTNNESRNAVHLAAKYGHMKVVKVLVEVYKERQKSINPGSISPSDDDSSVVSSLFIPDINGDTPLHLASAYGELPVVQYLLCEVKCSLTLVNHKKQNAVHLASKHGHVDVVKLLVETFQEIQSNPCSLTPGEVSADSQSAQDSSEESSATSVSQSNTSTSLCGLLTGDINGDSPLHLAISQGQLPVVKYLLHEVNCTPSLANNKGQSPFHLAVALNSENVFKMLFQAIRDRKKKAVSSCSKKLPAIGQENADSVATESSTGVLDESQDGTTTITENESSLPLPVSDSQINDADSDGNSVLHLAASYGNLPVIEYLLHEEDCSPTLANKTGQTALHIAAKHGHMDVVKVIVEKLKQTVQMHSSQTASHPDKHGDGAQHVQSDEQTSSHQASTASQDARNIDTPLSMATKVSATDNNGDTPLHLAAAHGHLPIVQYLLHEVKCSPTLVNHEGQSALHLAAKHGKMAIVKYFIKEGCSFTATDDHGQTLLFLASGGGHLDLVKYFTLDKEIDPSIKTTKRWKTDSFDVAPGRTLLHAASQGGHLDVVRFLMQEHTGKCDPSCTDDDGISPLFLACQQGHTEIVMYFIETLQLNPLLDKGTPLHGAAYGGQLRTVTYLIEEKKCAPACKDNKGDAPIHLAAAAGHLVVIEYLITENQCNPIERGYQGRIPLHYASEGGHLTVVKYFVDEQKVDPLCPDEKGNTSLHLASSRGHAEIVKFFIEEKLCDLQCKDGGGHTALDCAARGGKLDIVKYFITDKSCSPLGRCNGGGTLIHHACESSNLDMIKYLVSVLKLDPACSQKDGSTPLHVASGESHLEVVRYLVEEEKCSIVSDNNNRDIPLHFAASKGRLDVVKFFVAEKRCNVRAENRQGRTPLHLAAKMGHLDVMKYLVDHHADPFQSDEVGVTPLQLATESGHIDSVKYLVEEKQCNPLSTAFKIEMTMIIPSVTIALPGNESVSIPIVIKATLESPSIPLHSAGKHVNIAKYFIDDLQVNPSSTDQSKITLLLITAGDGHLDTVKYLMEEKECDPLFRTRQGNTALNVAALNGHLRVLKYLIDQKHYNPMEEGWRGRTPLHDASQQGYYEVVKYLVDEGLFNPSSPSEDGITPLHLAASGDHLEVVKFLLEKQCNPCCKDGKDNAPADLAARYGKWNTFLYFATRKYCNVMQKNATGRTALHHFCQQGCLDTVKQLVDELDADFTCKDDNGVMPLHVASVNGYLPVVRYLVEEKHCDHLCKDCDGDTPIHWAAIGGELEIIKYLINDKHCSLMEKGQCGKVPLHLACDGGHLEVVKYFVEQGVDPNCTDEKGIIPLHLAAGKGHLNVVEYLVKEKQCNPLYTLSIGISPLQLAVLEEHWDVVIFFAKEKNIEVLQESKRGMTALHHSIIKHDLNMFKVIVNELKADLSTPSKTTDTPLHLASSEGHLEIVKILTDEKQCDPLFKMDNGNNSLNYAALSGHLNVLQYFIDEKHCNPTEGGWRGRTPLHDASQNGHLHVVKYLAEKGSVDPSCTDVTKETALHQASKNGHLHVVKFLVEEANCNPMCENGNGDTPLVTAIAEKQWGVAKYLISLGFLPDDSTWGSVIFHKACANGRLDVMKCLVDKVTFNPSHPDDDGDTPLHMASECGNLAMVKYLVEKYQCSPLLRNNRGHTPINFAALGGHLTILKYYFSKVKNGPTVKGWQGRTPLHDACQEGQLNVVKYLAGPMQVDASCEDDEGVTPLHLACAKGHMTIAKYLVSEKHCDPSIRHPRIGSPIEWAFIKGNEDIAIYLFGKCTVVDRSSDILKFVLKKFPMLSPSVKIYIVGNRSSGKSTLTKAIYEENATFGSIRNVRGVEPKTAGIVPVEYTSKFGGKVILYDFAGHEEYYGSHEAFFESTSHPVILITVDLQLECSEISKTLKYWMSLVSKGVLKAKTQADVIVVGSHSDVVGKKNKLVLQEKTALLNEFVSQSSQRKSVHIVDYVTMDCRKPSSKGMERLREKLEERCRLARFRSDYNNKYAYLLHRFLSEKLSHRKAITFSQLFDRVIAEEDHAFIPLKSPHRLYDTCESLNSSGDIILLRSEERENSWIIREKGTILTKVHGILKTIKSSSKSANCSGIIPWSLIVEHTEDDASLVVEYMLKNEFCSEISSKSLEMIEGFGQGKLERYFFFPDLTSAKRPAEVAQINARFTYSFGWTLKCIETKSESNFFSPRFLQILLVRLVCQFAMGTGTTLQSQAGCMIWSNGIYWRDPGLVEATVEVIGMNTAVVVVVRCFRGNRESEMRCLQLRSQLIHEVLSIRDDFVKTEESLILPDCLQQYPPRMDSVLPMPRIAKAIINNDQSIVTDTPSSMPPMVEDLLLYEPLRFENSKIGRQLLRILFQYQNSRETIADNVLRLLSIATEHTRSRLAQVLDVDRDVVTKADHDQTKTDIEKCRTVLNHWLTYKGTYSDLCHQLNSYSIFARRNPLELCPEISVSSLSTTPAAIAATVNSTDDPAAAAAAALL